MWVAAARLALNHALQHVLDGAHVLRAFSLGRRRHVAVVEELTSRLKQAGIDDGTIEIEIVMKYMNQTQQAIHS